MLCTKLKRWLKRWFLTAKIVIFDCVCKKILKDFITNALSQLQNRCIRIYILIFSCPEKNQRIICYDSVLR